MNYVCLLSAQFVLQADFETLFFSIYCCYYYLWGYIFDYTHFRGSFVS